MPRPIRIHGLDEAQAAVAAAATLNCGVTLASAPAAAAHGGAGWFRALVAAASRDHPQVPVRAILDCAGLPGLVLAAVRAGVQDIAFSGPESVAIPLAEIATAAGATLHPPVKEALERRGAPDWPEKCRRWLAMDP